MLLDLLQPDEGAVTLDGINPAESEAWKVSTGAYIDEGFLIDFLTPEEYFAFLGKITNMTQEAVDERLEAIRAPRCWRDLRQQEAHPQPLSR